MTDPNVSESESVPDEGGLTSGTSSASIHDIIARFTADNDAPSDGEDGPADDAGELSDNPDDAADDDQDENEDPEQEPQADDESEPVAPAEPPETPPQPEPDPRELEIQRLKDLVTSSQETVTKLTEVLTQQGLSLAQPKKAQQRDEIPDAAIQLALYGRPDEENAWKALPAADRAEATRIALEHQAREAKYARNPASRYQEFRESVLQDTYQLLEPVIKDYYQRQADEAFREAAGSVTDPADKKRLTEIYQRLPGSKATLQEQREALRLAAATLAVEKQKSELERDRQKVDAKKRQQQAVANSRNKGSGGGRRSVTQGQNNGPPKLRPGDDLADYARRLADFQTGG